MRDDIIELCALAALHARGFDKVVAREIMTVCEQRHLADLHRSIARAVLATFKEATAEPTPGMIEAAIIDRDDDADWAKTMKHAHYVMHVQMYEEIGI